MRIKLFILFILCVFSAFFYFNGHSLLGPLLQKLRGQRTVAEAFAQYSPRAEKQLKEYFYRADAQYPPKKVVLIGLKNEKILEVWSVEKEKPVLIHAYNVLAASGHSGPKLVEGDRQVPEGFYKIEGLNPNSSYHLSLKLNYPNKYDLEKARLEGRENPGNNIFIHGKNASIGCLAMGDPAIEEIFVLVNRAGQENISVIIAPFDFRKTQPPENISPEWVSGLYQKVHQELEKYKP